MAMPDVRHFAIYIDNKKAFTANQNSLSIPTGRTAVFGGDGYLAHSKGALQTKLTLNEITPTGGSDLTSLLSKVKNHDTVDIIMRVGGKFLRSTMAVESFEFSSQSENGVATGTGTFAGGPFEEMR